MVFHAVFIEAILSIFERIQKFQTLENNKQVSSSSICKYSLLRKAETLLHNLYHPGNISRLLRVQELKCGKCI